MIALLFSFGLLSAAPAPFAGTSSSDQDRAGSVASITHDRDGLIRSAKALTELDPPQHEQALNRLEQAAAIRMTPSLRFFLASEQQAAGDLAAAHRNAKQCLLEATGAHDPHLWHACDDLRKAVESRVGWLLVPVSGNMLPGLVISVAGQPVGDVQPGTRYAMTPGPNRVILTAPGRAPRLVTVDVKPRKTVIRAADLPSASSAEVSPEMGTRGLVSAHLEVVGGPDAGLDSDTVEAVIRGSADEAERCYRKSPSANSGVPTNLRFLVTISYAGRVIGNTRATVTGSRDQLLEECLASIVSSWRFPASIHGMRMTLVKAETTFHPPPPDSAPARELSLADRQEVRRHYELATRAYDSGRYDKAAVEFATVFAIDGDAVMLFNIAQAFRLANQPTKAIDFYSRYLKAAPSARNRADVERSIAIERMKVIPQPKAAPPTPL